MKYLTLRRHLHLIQAFDINLAIRSQVQYILVELGVKFTYQEYPSSVTLRELQLRETKF